MLHWSKEPPQTSTKKEHGANTNIVLDNMQCQVVIEPFHQTPRKIDITFTAIAGRPIPPKELVKFKFSYIITGEGDVSDIKLIRGPGEVGNEKTLKDLLSRGLTVNDPQKSQFILQPGKATKVTIQFFLEKDGQKSSIGEYLREK